MIDPRAFTGTAEGTHDGDVAQRLTTSSVAAPLHSLVATNVGFFVTADDNGVQGTGSEGFTLYEEAEFMKSLGLVEVLNLDEAAPRRWR